MKTTKKTQLICIFLLGLVVQGLSFEANAKRRSRTTTTTTSVSAPIQTSTATTQAVTTSSTAESVFTISSPLQSSSNVAAGQSVFLSFKVKSSLATSGVDVYVDVLQSGSPDARMDLRNLSFSAGETKSLSVTYVPKITDRIGTKGWTIEVYDKLKLKKRLYTQRNVSMRFNQTTGVSIFAPFGPEYDNVCDNESTLMGAQCSLGSITVNIKALYDNDFFADSYRVTPSGCSASGSSLVCNTGSAEPLMSWQGSSFLSSDVPKVRNILGANIRDAQLGDERTRDLVAHSSLALDSAAHFCANLDYSGYTDWHLPNKSELALLFCRAIGNKRSNFPQEMPGCSVVGNYGYGLGSLKFNNTIIANSSHIYISSTEVDANRVWAIDFTTGEQFALAKSAKAAVRCIRKTHGHKF